jgi:hypothetical protein
MPIELRISHTGGRKIGKHLKRFQRPGSNSIFRGGLSESGVLVQFNIKRHVSGSPLKVRTGGYRKSIKTQSTRPERYLDVGTAERRVFPHEFGWSAKNFRKRDHFKPAVTTSVKGFPTIWDRAFRRAVR